MPKFHGLGRGLSSLIPKKIQKDILPQTSPVLQGTEDRVIQVEVDTIVPNPEQPRKYFDHTELEELASSIKEYGILQPLIATPLPDEKYQLITGERRWRAAKILGLKTVPVIVRKVERHKHLELSLIENIQRSNLNPIEEAVAYERLINEFNITHEELGRRLGKSRPVISNSLRLLNLPEEIQKALIEGKITYTTARTLAGLPEYEQMRFFSKIIKAELKIQELDREIVKIYGRRKPSRVKDPKIVFWEDKLREFLGTKVNIKKTAAGAGEIVIHFYSEDELQEIIRKFRLE